MRRAIRSLAFVLALLVLAAGAVHARPLAVHPSPAGFLSTLRHWVSPYLPAWTKEGGTMDPNGYTSKEGSTMDPNGYTSKEGGTMDPDGRTHPPLAPPPTTNAGGTMDPNG